VNADKFSEYLEQRLIMRFEAIGLDGAWLIHPEPMRDERGFFARTFCVNEFGDHCLETNFPQHSVSHSSRKGTVRGMHFQMTPHEEVKLVRCLTGSIFDVIIDLRPSSPTFRRWQGFELTGDNGLQLYIPKGFAHGFQTLTDDTGVNYLISEFHAPAAASGVRHDDPAFGIKWPLPVTAISDKDLRWLDFTG
jgi:dTDP-4-dehydrorhamnose 3,5-epimerase